jgi:hypothetical protein
MSISLDDNPMKWIEGRLKLYVWLLIGYLYVKNIELASMVCYFIHLGKIGLFNF